jgi:hypothetical protein
MVLDVKGVDMKRSMVLLAFVLATSCESAAQDDNISAPSAWTGVITSGFEEFSFRSCGQTEKWWLTSEPYGLLYPGCTDGRSPKHAPCLRWARIEGVLSPEGDYGHLSAYPHELKVTNVLEDRELQQGECP